MRYAVARGCFTPDDNLVNLARENKIQHDIIPLTTGLLLYVTSEYEGWCYGCEVEDEKKTGIFPSAMVSFVSNEPVEWDVDALIKELSKVLQQWWIRLKELYSTTASLDFMDEVMGYMGELLAVRKKIEAGGVSTEELHSIRNKVTRKIDRGNLLLSLNVTIRNSYGVPYDHDSPISVIKTYEEHLVAAKRVDMKSLDVPTDPEIFSLMVTIHSVENRWKHSPEISIVLYDIMQKRFLSETFTVKWDVAKALPAKELNIRCLFSHLRGRKESVGLLTRIAHTAPLESGSSTIRKGTHDNGTQYRQLCWYDVLDLNFVLSDPKPSNEAKERCIWLRRWRANSDQKEPEFDQLIKYGKMPKTIGGSSTDDAKMLISLQVLPGSAVDLRIASPHIFSRNPPAIAKTNEIFHSLKDEVRNEMMVTLRYGEFSGKSSDRSIECRMAIVDAEGELLSRCQPLVTTILIDMRKHLPCLFYISANRVLSSEIVTSSNTIPEHIEVLDGASTRLLSEYTSLVFFHCDKPCWMEHIKVRLPDRLEGGKGDTVNLRLSFFSRKVSGGGKDKGPFAIAWLCLLKNGTLAIDGEHELIVYKVDNYDVNKPNSQYLALPQTKSDLVKSETQTKPQSEQFSLSEKSVCVVSTQVCSGIMTQNDHIRTVLRWRMSPHGLITALAELSKTGETTVKDEMFRFFGVVMDTLFEIWVEREADELPVFNAIVAMLRLLGEKRYSADTTVFKSYLDRFPFDTAAEKLLRCLNHYVESANWDNHYQTRDTLQTIGPIFELIVQSKKVSHRYGSAIPRERFAGQLDAVLCSLERLIRRSESRRMAVQNTALRHLPDVIDPLLASMALTPLHIVKRLVSVMRGFANEVVARERLGFVMKLIDTQLFSIPDGRAMLLEPCLDIVVRLLELPFSAIQPRDDLVTKVRDCFGIIGQLLEKFFPVSGVGQSSSEELNLIIFSVYRPAVQAMVYIDMHNAQLVKDSEVDPRPQFFTVILALLHKMSAQMFSNYLAQFDKRQDKVDFLTEVVDMLRDVVQHCPFPPTWIHMIFCQNKIVSKMLTFVMGAIESSTASSEVVPKYLLALVYFVKQRALDTTHEWLCSERDARSQLARLRSKASADIRGIWNKLKTPDKLKHMLSLIGPLLEVALINDDEVRAAVIPIFSDMMSCGYLEQSSCEGFSKELMMQLEQLADDGPGTKAFQRQFRALFRDWSSEPGLWQSTFDSLMDKIDQLITSLIEYRMVKESRDCVENVMSRTVQLMRFYERNDMGELYMQYVFHLYDLHIVARNNEVEAARTLLLLASMLSWADCDLNEFVVSRCLNRHCDSERRLKENLMLEAAELFTQGAMWEDAIGIYKEIVEIYEKVDMNYTEVAKIMDTIAGLFRRIDTEQRPFFNFYHVGFYGKGFPAYLNGNRRMFRFVFRSDQLEQRGAFEQRMKEHYGASVVSPNVEDPSNLLNDPGRFIHIFVVVPVRSNDDLEKREVNPAIKDYYRNYHISEFEYVRLEQHGDTKWTKVEDSEVMRTWVVKRKLILQEPLPGLLRFSQVKQTTPATSVSPLRHAVDQMRAKNASLRHTCELVQYLTLPPVKQLSQEVHGVIQAAVMGGIKNYENFLSDACCRIYQAEEKKLAMDLSALVIEQVEILELCIWRHKQLVGRLADRSIHENLVTNFIAHKQYVEDKFGQTRSVIPIGESLNVALESMVQGDMKTSSSDRFLPSESSSTLRQTKHRLLHALNKSNITQSTVNLANGFTTGFSSQTLPRGFSMGGDRLSVDAPLSPAPNPSPARTRLSSASNASIIGVRLRGSQDPPPLPPRL